jgi:hypothetical protein
MLRKPILALPIVSFGLIVACAVTAEPEAAPAAPAASNSTAEPKSESTTQGPKDEVRWGAFLPAERCAVCHSQSPRARAMTTATGDDVSPVGTWSATMMANSFRDPYWRAQMATEIEAEPHLKREIEGLCLRCHAPMASQQARLDGLEPPTIEAALASPLAPEGVSCTVCHQAQPANLGTAESFSGRIEIKNDKQIFGPYADPATAPMRMHTGYTPTQGEHISSSALCGACHTLYTQAAGAKSPFLEQAPYLEWRNSVFSDEGQKTEQSRSCVECHMMDAGSMRIARNPGGVDFNIRVRDEVRAHTMVGGNAFMTDMLRANREALGVTATDEALKRVATASRALLAHQTANLEVLDVRRSAERLEFGVKVENLTGHKLPSGYPSRRAWLRVEVRQGQKTLFQSGGFDTSGRLVNQQDEFAIPHLDLVRSPNEVIVYEMVAHDGEGHPTTSLAQMETRHKDSRLLPKGWRKDGPHGDETAPVGTEADPDFAAGGDVAHYSVELPADAQGDLIVVVWMMYQSIPPAWVDGLRGSRTEEAKRFLDMYATADKKPETIGTAVAVVPSGK